MNNMFNFALKCFGTPLTFEKGNKVYRSYGVLMPYRDVQKNNGGVTHKGNFRNEPDKFVLYTDDRFLHKAVRGDTVSDGKNEYYILWKDVFTSRKGSYTKAALRKTGGCE